MGFELSEAVVMSACCDSDVLRLEVHFVGIETKKSVEILSNNFEVGGNRRWGVPELGAQPFVRQELRQRGGQRNRGARVRAGMTDVALSEPLPEDGAHVARCLRRRHTEGTLVGLGDGIDFESILEQAPYERGLSVEQGQLPTLRRKANAFVFEHEQRNVWGQQRSVDPGGRRTANGNPCWRCLEV